MHSQCNEGGYILNSVQMPNTSKAHTTDMATAPVFVCCERKTIRQCRECILLCIEKAFQELDAVLVIESVLSSDNLTTIENIHLALNFNRKRY